MFKCENTMSKLPTIETVGVAYHGFTILKYLIQGGKFHSISEIRQSLKMGNIKINDITQYTTNFRISQRDQISIIVDEVKLNTIKLQTLCNEEYSFSSVDLKDQISYKVIYKFGGSSLELICDIYSKIQGSKVKPIYGVDKACYGLVKF